MESLYFLIPIAILFVTIAVKVFFWAVNNGQYDDLETEGRRILFDDDVPSSARDHAEDGPGDATREEEADSGVRR